MLKLRAPVCRFIFFWQPLPLIYSLLAENFGDPSGKLWSMYITEAEKEDEQITKKWFEDTGGFLVFVSSKASFYMLHT